MALPIVTFEFVAGQNISKPGPVHIYCAGHGAAAERQELGECGCAIRDELAGCSGEDSNPASCTRSGIGNKVIDSARFHGADNGARRVEVFKAGRGGAEVAYSA